MTRKKQSKSKTKETPKEKKLRQYRKMQRQIAETSIMAASFDGVPEGYPPIALSEVAKVVKTEEQDSNDEITLTVAEALFNVSKVTLRRRIKKGEIYSRKSGTKDNSQLMVRKSEIGNLYQSR